MKLALPIFLMLASHVIAQPPAVDRWRVENVESGVTYTPQVVPPPFSLAVAEVGVIHEATVGAPGGAVIGFMRIRVNNNYNCDCGPVTALGYFEFDFISEIESEIDLSVGGRFGMLSMTSGGNEVVWDYPTTIDPLQPLIIPPGAYHFTGRMEGTGLDANNWGQLDLNIHPVPEPSAIFLVTMTLLFYLAVHRRVLKGLRFQRRTEVSGIVNQAWVFAVILSIGRSYCLGESSAR